MGTDQDDTLWGFEGSDTLEGMGGDDLLEGAGGADKIDGGSGMDTVSYRSSDGAVHVDLVGRLTQGEADPHVFGGDAEGDTLVSIENVYGSDNGADTLKGNGRANLIIGWGGDDYILGREGNDSLHGGGGADEIMGGSGMDVLFGGMDDDNLDGGSGMDTVVGEMGDDIVKGGGGGDLLSGGMGDDTLPVAHNFLLDFLPPLRYGGRHGDSESGLTYSTGQPRPPARRAGRGDRGGRRQPRSGRRPRL